MKSEADVERSVWEGLTPEQEQRLSQVLDEYFSSLEQGRPIRAEDLVARHPDLAGPLAIYLESLDFLQEAAAGFCPSAESQAAGKQLGDFELVREIGRGGMGVVYEARQLSLNRRVALKVLPFAALLDAKQIARFRNEAQAAAQLHHPHIVPVFAVGTDRGVHYYAMQLIDGQPLDRAVDELRLAARDRREDAPQQPPPTSGCLAREYSREGAGYFREVARLGIQAAEALHAAHEFGIVHRDVKPSNLLLDAEGELWVTDFGLARCRTDANLTRSGDFVGTVRYMSPEQTRGRSPLIDHRTDIYSLGATLYELLTLRPALRGTNVAGILRQLDRDEPYRPSLWNANIPLDLENIVRKTMAKSRDERYATAQDLADDLRRYLEGKPTVAKRPTLPERTVKWARRHKRSVACSVLALAVAVVGLVISTLLLARQKQQTEWALAEAKANFRQYRAQLALSNNHLGLLHNQNGDVRQAETSFQKALRLQREILQEQPDEEEALRSLATSLNNLAFLYAETDPARAGQCFEEALGLQHRLVDAFPDNIQHQCDLALTYGNCGAQHRRQDRPRRAAACYRELIALLLRVRRAAPQEGQAVRNLAVSYNNLGMTQHALGELAESEQSFRQALQIAQRPQVDGERAAGELSSLGGIHNNLAMVLEGQEKLADAADRYALAVQYQQAASEQAPQVEQFREFLSRHYYNYGRVLRKSGRLTEASAAAQRRRELFRGDPRHLASVAEELALLARAAGGLGPAAADSTADAERYAEQAVEVLRAAADRGLEPGQFIRGSQPLLGLRQHAEIQAWLGSEQASAAAQPAEVDQ